MGKIFKGKVWGKVRPMIEIKEDEVEYHAGISHSKKEGMVEMTEQDLKEGSNLPLIPKSYAGLCNKSPMKIGLGEMGETTEEFDKKVLEANQKLQQKIEKRSK